MPPPGKHHPTCPPPPAAVTEPIPVVHQISRQHALTAAHPRTRAALGTAHRGRSSNNPPPVIGDLTTAALAAAHCPPWTTAQRQGQGGRHGVMLARPGPFRVPGRSPAAAPCLTGPGPGVRAARVCVWLPCPGRGGSDRSLTGGRDDDPMPSSVGRGGWVFFREFVRAPLRTASVVPSSRALAVAMVPPFPRAAGEGCCPVVVELGPGTGAFTQLIGQIASSHRTSGPAPSRRRAARSRTSRSRTSRILRRPSPPPGSPSRRRRPAF